MLYKKRMLTGCVLAILLCSIHAVAGYSAPGNRPPVLTHIEAKPDYKKNVLTVSYHLDADANDKVSIQLVLLDASGKEVPQTKMIIRGDVGPVSANAKKTITIRFNQLSLLRKVQSVKLIADDTGMPGFNTILRDFDSVRLVKNLVSVGKERNLYSASSRRQLDEVRAAIRKNFTDAGISVSVQHFKVKDVKGENIIGTIRSKKPGAKTLVIGAHYDTVEGSPGLDDNGTGISALMEVATILSKYSFDYNIRFVAFDLEETISSIPDAQGIEGSAAFVRDSLEKPGNVIGCINLDMIGYSTDTDNSQQFPEVLKGVFPEIYSKVEQNKFRGNFLLVISNDASAALSQTLDSLNEKFVPNLRTIIVPVPGKGEMMPDFRRSDHANFWDKDYAAISLGDGAFSRNPHYHSAQDEFTDINLGFFSSVTRLLLLTIAKEARINNSTIMTSKVSHH